MTQQVHNTVFISYRRSTSSYLARAIYMDLKQHGYDVFMDVQSIDSGQFDTMILRQIEARAHFLLLCTPGTFERINEPGDWLRREIEHAMDHQRNIVPLMASDFRFDDVVKKLLTGKLADLPRYNALNAPHDYFEEALERLRTRFLKQSMGITLGLTPTSDLKAIAGKRAEIESKAKPTQSQLNAQEHLLRGIALKEKSRYESAIVEYDLALQIDEQYAEAYAERARCYNALKVYGKALQDIAVALKLNPKSATAHYARGYARENGLNDHLGALSDFSEAIHLNPQFYLAHIARGLIYRNQSDYDKAVEDFTEAIRIKPQDPDAYFYRGLTKQNKLDHTGAIADYDQVIRHDARNSGVYFNRGLVYENIGHYSQALADFQRYIELPPPNPDLYWTQEAEKHIRELKQKLGIK